MAGRATYCWTKLINFKKVVIQTHIHISLQTEHSEWDRLAPTAPLGWNLGLGLRYYIAVPDTLHPWQHIPR